MTGGLAIFVKTPGLSPVKSRLAGACGEEHAVGWYLKAATAVASVARAARSQCDVAAYWAVAEGHAKEAWPDLPVIAQGDGGLGARMARVHAALVERHGFGLLLGADAPQLTVELLAEAIDWLSDPAPRLLLGPASDGGFWLFGANVVPAVAAWTRVQYSAAGTARELQRSMHGRGEWRTLPTLTDLDTADDWAAVSEALRILPAPTPEQRALARWMRLHPTPDAPHA